MSNAINEILKANSYIDKKLSEMNSDNRGEKSLDIIMAVRNLNDNIALKLYQDLYPDKSMGPNKAASQFKNHKEYKFISKFDKFLQKSVSHFTPSEDGAERLLIKYYDYLLQLKKLVKNEFNLEILLHIDNFLDDIDEQTQEYYDKVCDVINQKKYINVNNDIYYINRIKPFRSNKKIYYEVTLELANDKSSKFNRLTAFTNCKIDTFYSVELSIARSEISIFGVELPILIITNWDISIRPCELINFSRIVDVELNIQRSYIEYKVLMKALKEEGLNLVDIVELEDEDFKYLKEKINLEINRNRSAFFEVLEKCREIISKKEFGKNILKYLLFRMNNRLIKDQWPKSYKDHSGNLFLSTKCKPFEDHPYSFNPPNHISNYNDIAYSIGVVNRKSDILARFINTNTINNKKLYTSFEELSSFGTKKDIVKLIDEYNKSLHEGFKPRCCLKVYKDYVYKCEYEDMTISIIKNLLNLSSTPSSYSHLFEKDKIDKLKILKNDNKLDDSNKELILTNMFEKSRVHFIYGPAGTGKTKIVNHITNLMKGTSKIYLAKTNAAVSNLKQKVINREPSDNFITIEKCLSGEYLLLNYDLIVIDECSTVKNEEILKILELSGNAIIVLVGDIYQIEAIGYGNWFEIVKKIVPSYCCHTLDKPYRTTKRSLINLWDEVRNIKEDNVVLETMVRNDFSSSLDNNIFNKYDEDEIILCLNYNGLYGLNNINKLMQLNNPNPSVDIGILQYKKDDPILFNDSNRFLELYNNLKGKIVDIIDQGSEVLFKIEVNIKVDNDILTLSEGLTVESSCKNSTIVSFIVKKNTPYLSDNDTLPKEYIMPFQIAYAVSIHKSQGLEYKSVKIVIADDSEDMITHNIFYTAITRAREKLTIYWSPEVCSRVLKKIVPIKDNKDFNIIISKEKLDIS